MYPRIYLAIDNCFASKRWTQPIEWMKQAAELGVQFVEASADTELDPLYHGSEYLARWQEDVMKAQDQTGVRVANLYSGHGTYATLGLAHPDRRIRERVRDQWLKPMVDIASSINAGLGFFCHAFHQAALADSTTYESYVSDLIENLADIAAYSAERKPGQCVGVEQMYSPHQVPWTISQARELLQRIHACGQDPFYITIDLGHQSGQWRFAQPTYGAVKETIRVGRKTGRIPHIWLGPDPLYDLLEKAVQSAPRNEESIVHEILQQTELCSYLYAQPHDGDPYVWLEQLAGWSPIIHLQQTDGRTSAHWPFTDEANRNGIVDGRTVLESIYRHYDGKEDDSAMPPRASEIYLTLEVFSGTAESAAEIRRKLRRSVEYWRRYVPEDGCTIDELIKGMGDDL